MKKIGFVDYYISEWHANNYPKWIEQACAEMGIEAKVSYVYAERDVSPIDSRSTGEWCRAFGTTACESIDELCRLSDWIIILAPSDPDRHLPYAREVFKHGKPVFIDKTFAPSFDEGRMIFDEARRYGTPFFSSSALRYATELGDSRAVDFTAFGSGSNLEEYAIHTVEMLVKKLGLGAVSVKHERVEEDDVFAIGYPDERCGRIVYGRNRAFAAIGDGKEYKISSDYFAGQIRDIMRFFLSGEVSFDTEETLEAMRIRDAMLDARERGSADIKV